ncbi:unnamed protein product [Brachionus calyciflorus]|uniref:Uncharacterized protein n=1 Tax=Brachionus calyciflorus TaxID=104777 RepID=A0A814FJ40_9BILA|nr:unnamed protein product [Brachionus calyciflorus]
MRAFLLVASFLIVMPYIENINWRETLPIDDIKLKWDTKKLNTPNLNFQHWSFGSLSTYLFNVYGDTRLVDIRSKNACRLNSNPCRRHSDCCSKFCRCTKWKTMGSEGCLRKCF